MSVTDTFSLSIPSLIFILPSCLPFHPFFPYCLHLPYLLICTNSSGSGSGRVKDTYMTVRNATTPPLDLRLVRAVKPPHAPQMDNSCNENQTKLYEHLISLLLFPLVASS